MNADADRLTTAFHEAGHAWAYCWVGRRLRYVTVRPRTVGAIGMTMPMARMIDPGTKALIAMAGPVARAMHSLALDAVEDYDWADHLGGAVLSGGHDDVGRSMGMLNDPGSVEVIRSGLTMSWSKVELLAARLATEHTVTGREVAAIFG